MTPEEKPVLDHDSAQETINELIKMRDRNVKQKYIICNKAFNDAFKRELWKDINLDIKATFDTVCGFKYIVSPYIKEKERPVMYITELDLNKICGVNSTYEGTTIYIEDFLYNNIKQEWQATQASETETAE